MDGWMDGRNDMDVMNDGKGSEDGSGDLSVIFWVPEHVWLLLLLERCSMLHYMSVCLCTHAFVFL